MNTPYSAYDQLAWFYNRYWGARFPAMALPILDRLLLSALPSGARILDLCCGTGHVTKAVAERGFDVVGIDGSLEMLRFARGNVPAASFVHANACAFAMAPAFDAAIATFDSINHIMSAAELSALLANVRGALKDGGRFVFDINDEAAYLSEWGKSSWIVEADNACIVRGGYDPRTRNGRTEITMFRLDGCWQRADVSVGQHCYRRDEIDAMLSAAGFRTVQALDAQNDLGARGEIGIGRIFFIASV